MIKHENLPEQVVQIIKQAQKGAIYNEVLFEDSSAPMHKNEFLFFVKPEITLPSETIQLDAIFEMIFKKMAAFNFSIHRIRILSAEYIKEHDLIDQHYQVIANVSKQGVAALTMRAKNKLKELYQVEVDDVLVLGGIQFMNRYPFFNDLSLDCMWQNSENFKIASGAYAEKLKVDTETVYLLNGFHPRQLRHFTNPGRSLVVFRISSDLTWKEARDHFAGATIPSNAFSDSIRHTLLEGKEAFGIPIVSQSYNGIHLSAGPVEGLIELNRFDSDLTNAQTDESYHQFTFGQKLIDRFGKIPQAILQNLKMEVDGRKVSVFDLTEDMDSDDALELLSKHCMCNK